MYFPIDTIDSKRYKCDGSVLELVQLNNQL